MTAEKAREMADKSLLLNTLHHVKLYAEYGHKFCRRSSSDINEKTTEKLESLGYKVIKIRRIFRRSYYRISW